MQSQSHPQTMQNSLLHLLLATFSSSQYKFFLGVLHTTTLHLRESTGNWVVLSAARPTCS